jgi:hypothetical protein
MQTPLRYLEDFNSLSPKKIKREVHTTSLEPSNQEED